MNPLEQRTGYKFRNSLLLAEALTHPSLGHETQRHHFDNQRLEFLGDAVLQLIFTEHLYRLFPHFSEGQLTKLRSRLVSREGLKVHAINIGLGTFLMMGRGEEASGGRQRASILADAFEALVGAIYLDSNLDVVRRFVLDEAQSDIQRLTHQPLEVNPKGQLQEILQAISPQSPSYQIVSQTGPEHQKQFVAKVLWHGLELGSGEGPSKKQAETAAALNALKAKRWEEAPVEVPSPPSDPQTTAPAESPKVEEAHSPAINRNDVQSSSQPVASTSPVASESPDIDAGQPPRKRRVVRKKRDATVPPSSSPAA